MSSWKTKEKDFHSFHFTLDMNIILFAFLSFIILILDFVEIYLKLLNFSLSKNRFSKFEIDIYTTCLSKHKCMSLVMNVCNKIYYKSQNWFANSVP